MALVLYSLILKKKAKLEIKKIHIFIFWLKINAVNCFMGKIKICLGLAMLLSIGFFSCTKKYKHATPHELYVIDDSKDEQGINFLVFGDWGRKGNNTQKTVAEQMALTAEKTNPDFIIVTGDNFYNTGVTSTEDEHWDASYKEVYHHPELQVDWFLALGNHDYQGDVPSQIEYSQKDERWHMSDRYYSIDKTIDPLHDVRFVFIDSSPFFDPYYEHSHYSNVWDQDTLSQLNWIDQTLESSAAKWNIVISHHPLYTSGMRRGETQYVQRHVKRLMDKYEVNAVFSGHEHDLQHQKPDGNTHYFVSGSASDARDVSYLDYTKFAAGIPGFMSVTLFSDRMIVQAIDANGVVLYSTEITK